MGCARKSEGAGAEPRAERARTKRTEGRGRPTERSGEGGPRAEDGKDEQGEGGARARLRARTIRAGRTGAEEGAREDGGGRGTVNTVRCYLHRTESAGHTLHTHSGFTEVI